MRENMSTKIHFTFLWQSLNTVFDINIFYKNARILIFSYIIEVFTCYFFLFITTNKKFKNM